MILDRYFGYDKIIVEFSVKVKTKDGEKEPYDLNFPWGNEITCEYSRMTEAIKKMIEIVDNSTQGGFSSFKKEVTKYGGIRLTRKIAGDPFDEDENDPYRVLPHDAEDYYTTEEVYFSFTTIESRSFNDRMWLENSLGLRTEKMEFMRIIAEAEKDLNFSMVSSYDRVVRPHFHFGEEISLSVQGSSEHRCEPREYGPITNYKALEICLKQGEHYKHPEKLIDIPPEFEEELTNSGGSYVFGNVPVETVEYVFQALKEKYGFVRYHKEVDGTLKV
jgi:hypothetical protein